RWLEFRRVLFRSGRWGGRELPVDLGAHELELQRTHAFPRGRVMLEDEVEQLADDAVLGRREVATFDARVKASVAAEQIVDHKEHEVRVEHEERRAAQRLYVDEV